ncbi:SDR family NAD(P)-dependent oxidoreductase, partial [Leuconostoc mesenteroides]|uniref:SDR family NAD(P)-dependent oxidoreductase n=1 Tax=Leuconostoc mesenteroides TaxID=1245 RepID=UPI00236067F8
ARKKPYNKGNDADRLDLIIVSDQLLTGFDSKFVNIINMSSILGLVGDTMTASYNASKGAVRLFSKSAAVYAAQNDLNIRVNTVHPGLHRNAID